MVVGGRADAEGSGRPRANAEMSAEGRPAARPMANCSRNCWKKAGAARCYPRGRSATSQDRGREADAWCSSEESGGSRELGDRGVEAAPFIPSDLLLQKRSAPASGFRPLPASIRVKAKRLRS